VEKNWRVQRVARVPQIGLDGCRRFSRGPKITQTTKTRGRKSRSAKNTQTQKHAGTEITWVHYHADHKPVKTKSRSSKIPLLPKSRKPKITLKSRKFGFYKKIKKQEMGEESRLVVSIGSTLVFFPLFVYRTRVSYLSMAGFCKLAKKTGPVTSQLPVFFLCREMLRQVSLALPSSASKTF
jgi:hypothetical protein